MSQSLIKITDEMIALETLLEEMGGDVTDESAGEYVSKLFDEINDALNYKVDAYATLIRKCEMTAAARSEEADALKAGARTEENKAKWLKANLKAAMERLGIKKAGYIRTASICGNGGKPPLIVTVSAAELPPQYQRVVIVANEDAIRAAIEAGTVLPFARIEDRGTHVRVK